VGVGLHVGEVVYRDNLDVVNVPLQNRAESQAANPAETVDAYAYRHF
jgi:hypothetical protein